MKEYFVVIEGKPAGPYSVEQMKDLGIKPGTFVKTEDMDDYKEAHDVPELCDLLGIKRHIREPQYFASLDIRLLAVIIDYFIIFGIYCVIAMMVVLFIDEKQLRIAVSLAGLAIIPVAKMIYSILMEASSRQGTWGKVLLGLKVSDEHGVPIKSGRSILRNLSKILSAGTIGIGYIIGFFDKRQQCLHDRIAGTLVIRDRLI